MMIRIKDDTNVDFYKGWLFSVCFCRLSDTGSSCKNVPVIVLTGIHGDEANQLSKVIVQICLVDAHDT